MVKHIWIFLVSFLAAMLEIFFSGWGIIFPGTLFLVFYLVVSYNKTTAIVTGSLACISTEIALGRAITALPLFFPVIIFANFWRHSGERRFLPFQSISGVLIGFFYYLYCLCGENFSLWFSQLFEDISFILSLAATLGISAIALPLLLCFLDFSSQKLDMQKFSTKKRVYSK